MSRNPNRASNDSIAGPLPEALLVRFEAVCIRLGAERRVDGLSFSIASGSVHFLTGPAGSGKTAVADLIGLAGPSYTGRIELLGRDLAALDRRARPWLRQRVGMIFQDLRLIDEVSAFDNVGIAARVAGRKSADYHAQVAELLAWVGLGRRLDVLAGALSAPERRRLAIARAVINSPDLVVADEPAAGLDSPARDGVLRLLAALNQAGTAVLIASRDEGLAARSGARVIRLEGRSSAGRAHTDGVRAA